MIISPVFLQFSDVMTNSGGGEMERNSIFWLVPASGRSGRLIAEKTWLSSYESCSRPQLAFLSLCIVTGV